MPQHGPAGNIHNVQAPAQQAPFVPSFFDSFQHAFGVDNARTRQLAALRAGSEGVQPDPNFLPQVPRQVPGGGQAVGGIPGQGGFLTDISQVPGQLGDKFTEGLRFLQDQFGAIPSPTDVKVQQALEQAGVHSGAPPPPAQQSVGPQSAINPAMLQSFVQQLRNFG